MARRNISLPDDLDEQARRARLNVSALAQRAVADELDRRARMAALDAWLDNLDATQGVPSAKAKTKDPPPSGVDVIVAATADGHGAAGDVLIVTRDVGDFQLLGSLVTNGGRLSLLGV